MKQLFHSCSDQVFHSAHLSIPDTSSDTSQPFQCPLSASSAYDHTASLLPRVGIFAVGVNLLIFTITLSSFLRASGQPA
jgi:hypothetical protein